MFTHLLHGLILSWLSTLLWFCKTSQIFWLRVNCRHKQILTPTDLCLQICSTTVVCTRDSLWAQKCIHKKKPTKKRIIESQSPFLNSTQTQMHSFTFSGVLSVKQLHFGGPRSGHCWCVSLHTKTFIKDEVERRLTVFSERKKKKINSSRKII